MVNHSNTRYSRATVPVRVVYEWQKIRRISAGEPFRCEYDWPPWPQHLMPTVHFSPPQLGHIAPHDVAAALTVAGDNDGLTHHVWLYGPPYGGPQGYPLLSEPPCWKAQAKRRPGPKQPRELRKLRPTYARLVPAGASPRIRRAWRVARFLATIMMAGCAAAWPSLREWRTF